MGVVEGVVLVVWGVIASQPLTLAAVLGAPHQTAAATSDVCAQSSIARFLRVTDDTAPAGVLLQFRECWYQRNEAHAGTVLCL